MVQVGATVSYHDQMDEQPEESWAAAIRSAVHEFVEAVSASSRQLAGATERFAVESLQAVDAARSRTEESAEASREMARQAREAAEEARNATSGLQAAVDEAREMLRNEARLSVEQVTQQTAQINEFSAQVKNDLQQRIDEMVARLEAGTAGHQEALETAQAATTAARAAADRIESSVHAVEAAVSAARSAAEEARRAAEQTAEKAGSVSQAVATAQEAAESSRQSASFAEQAGKRSDFAAEASMLLERLETDYSLLTRLVQELHSRISSLSSVSVAPPTPVYRPEPDATPGAADDGATYAVETPESTSEPAYAAPDAVESEPAPEAAGQSESGWQPEAETMYAQNEAGAAWPAQAADVEAPAVAPAWQAAQEPVAEAPVVPAASETASVSPSITLFGRVQTTISPVPDFDRLLSLDSALARIKDVHSVTLADYAREEVIFRVELEQPVSVFEFTRQLSDTAGVSAEVIEASESTLSIRIS